jgi:hypothetical protein
MKSYIEAYSQLEFEVSRRLNAKNSCRVISRVYMEWFLDVSETVSKMSEIRSILTGRIARQKSVAPIFNVERI